MAKDTTSPFTPGRPVPVEFFVGRMTEIKRLRRKVRNSIDGKRVEVAFVAGERGIGKSSIASFVRYLCEKEDGTLGIHTFLGGVGTVELAVKKVFDHLLKEHADGRLFDSIKSLFGDHVRKVGLFGVSVEFAPDERELAALANNFGVALRNLLDRIKDQKNGILLILDDINGLAKSEDFANWTKSLVDELSTSRPAFPLCILFVGLDERRRALVELQPSLARIFDPIEIQAWSDEEATNFFEEALSQANLHCNADAMELMTRYTGGLPVLAHEIGDAVFHRDTDGVVDKQDALDGVVTAANVVGSKYLDPLVYDSIRSAKYRTILRRIAQDLPNERFTRKSVLSSLSEGERGVFDNFVGKMKQLGVIVNDPDSGPGCYRFTNRLHQLYFFFEADQADQS